MLQKKHSDKKILFDFENGLFNAFQYILALKVLPALFFEKAENTGRLFDIVVYKIQHF